MKGNKLAINIGDVFEDKDARRKGRRVTVRFIEGDYATVEDQKGSTTDVKLKRLEKRFRKVGASGTLTAEDLQNTSLTVQNATLTVQEDDEDQTLTPAQQGVVDETMARLGYVRLPSSEVLLERTLDALKTGEHTVTGIEDLAKVIISQI